MKEEVLFANGKIEYARRPSVLRIPSGYRVETTNDAPSTFLRAYLVIPTYI